MEKQPKLRSQYVLYSVRVKPVAAAVAAALLAAYGAPRTAYAGPAGEQVVGGQATVNRPDAQTTVINQATQRAAIDWNGFSINVGEAVIFRQPNVSSVALNRVVGPDPSRIAGTLQANGQVFLINPSGILFARGASVDVAGLVASTLNIGVNDFMSGRYVFSGLGGNVTVEKGASIKAGERGYVALLANQVSNSGTLTASNGTVALGAGSDMVLDFHGDGLLSLKVNASAAGAKISHDGIIVADGGHVIMSAQARNALLDTVLNVEGIVQASGAVERDGSIYLEGGDSGVMRVAGTLDVSNAHGKGGEVRVLGQYVGLFDRARIDASGATGGGTVLVGGDYQGKNPEARNALRTSVGHDVTINADATVSGNGGKVVVWSDDTTRFDGAIAARGGAHGGEGGFVEVSGKRDLVFNGSVNVGSPQGRTGTLLLDPETLIIDGGGPNAGPNDDALLTDNQVLFAENPGGTTTITEATLESINANILLEATKLIRTGATAFTDGRLTIAANRSLTLRTRNSSGSGDGGGTHGIDLTNGGANAPEIVLQGSGTFSATSGFGDGTNNGDVPASVTLGAITTNGGSVTVRSSSTLTVNNAITTMPAAGTGAAGGAVTLTATGTITSAGGGTITTIGASGIASPDSATPGGTGGKGGDVLVQSTGNGAVTLNGAIVTSGGAGGSGFLVDDGNGNFIPVTPGGVSGAGGAVTVQSGGASAVISVDTSGGAGPNSGGAGGAITLQGPVVLAANATLTSTGGSAGGEEGSLVGDGGSILFTATVNSASGAETLTLNPGNGNVAFQGIVGGGLAPAAITINSGLNVGGSFDASTPAAAITAGSFTQTGGGSRTHLSTLTAPGAVNISTNEITITGSTSASDVVLNAGIIGVGPITSGGGIALTTFASGVATLGGNLTTTANGNISIDHTVLLGADVAAAAGSGTITFNRSIDSVSGGPARALTLNTSGATTLNGAIGFNTALASLTTDANGTTALNGGPAPSAGSISSVTTTGAQTYNDPLTLGANTTMTSTGGAITFGSTIQSGFDSDIGQNALATLTVNTSGITRFNAAVHVVGSELGGLSAGGGGTTEFAGASAITVNGPQTYNDAVVLFNDVAFQGCNCTPAPITFGGNINANPGATNRVLGVSARGDVTFSGNVGNDVPLAALSATTNGVAGATIVFNGASAQTLNVSQAGSGGILLANPVTLASGTNVTLNAGTELLQLAGTIDGGGALTTLAGQTLFQGAIGNTTPLTSLNAISNGSGVDIAGGTVRTTGAQAYGTLTLSNSTTLTGTVGGNVTFNGTVDSVDNTTARTLAITTTGTTRFGDTVGAGNRLGSLTVTGGGPIAINDVASSGVSIGTTGAQTYGGPVALSGNVFLVSDSSGAISFASTIDSTASVAASPLTVTTDGPITFGGAVGATRALDALTTNGPGATAGGPVTVNVPVAGIAIITNNAQTYGNKVTLVGAAGPVEFRTAAAGDPSTSSLTFGGTGDALVAGAHPLTLTADGLNFGGNVRGSSTLLIQPTAAGKSIGVAGGGGGDLSLGDATLARFQDGFTQITIGRADSMAFTQVNPVTFGDPVLVRGGIIVVAGDLIGTDNASVTLTPTALPVFNGRIDLGANIRTSGQPITLNGPVRLEANTVLVDSTCASGVGCTAAAAGADVTFASTVASLNNLGAGIDRTLTVNAGTVGTATFGGHIGVGTGAALADLDVTARTIRLNGATVNLNDANAAPQTVTLSGDLVLGADVTISTNRGGTSNSVTFNGAIDGDNTTTGRALAINAGNATVTFNGVIGSIGSLSDFDVTAGGIAVNTTTINVIAPNAAVAPTVTLNGLTTLAAGGLTLSTSGHGGGAGSVTFGQIDGPGGLQVLAPVDTITFGGLVGASSALPSLTASGARINLNAATFNLDGGTDANGIAFTGPVFLGAPNVSIDADRAGTADSAVSFSGTINADNGANDRVLNVNAGSGIVTIAGAVGTTGALSGLTVTAGTRIDLNAATYNINGGTAGGNVVAFNGPVELNGATLVSINTDRAGSTSDNNVSFGSTINAGSGSNALDVNAGSGSVSFNGNVGTALALTNLTVTGSSINLNAPTFNLDGGTTAQTAAFNGPVNLGANVAIDTDRTGVNDSSVTFGSSIVSSGSTRSLTVTAGQGTATFSGAIGSGGGVSPLADLDVTARSIVFNGSLGNQPVVISGGAGTTVGLNGGVTIATTLLQVTTSGASVSFGGSVLGQGTGADNRSLIANAGSGTVTFNNDIGDFGIGASSGALSSVGLTGSTINLNGNVVAVNRASPAAATSTFNGPVVLGSPADTQVFINAEKFSGADNSLSFTSSISGASHPLELRAGTGQISATGTTTAATLDALASTINLGPVSTTGNTTLTADNMTLNGISSPGQTVTLRSLNAGRAILLGGDSASSLALNAAELNGITAQRLIIGTAAVGSASGAITIAGDVAPNVSVLHLNTGGGITGTAGGIVLPAGSLAINAGGTVNVTDAQNDVGTLAVNAGANDVTFTNAGTLAIGTVDGVTGVTGANVTLTSTSGQIAGAGAISGGNVVLDSATGVGTGTGGRVNTTATTLAARSRTGGGVFVNETNDVTLSTIGGVTNSAAGSQGYDVVAGGAISVGGPVNTADATGTSGGITLLANGNITGSGTLTTGNATASDGGTARVGDITLTANRIGVSGIPQLIAFGTAFGGSTNTQGSLDVATTGISTAADVEAGQILVASTTALPVRNITTAANNTQAIRLEARGGTLTFLGGGVDTGLAGSGNALDGDSLNAVTTGAGNNIAFARAMTVGSVMANSAAALNVNANLVTSTVTAAGSTGTVASGGISVTAQSSITGAGTLATGDVTLTSPGADAIARSGGIMLSATGIGTAAVPQAVRVGTASGAAGGNNTNGLLSVTSTGAGALGNIFVSATGPARVFASTAATDSQTVDIRASGALSWTGQGSGISGSVTAFDGDSVVLTTTGAGGNIAFPAALVAGNVTLNASGAVDTGSGIFLQQVDRSGAAPGTSASTGSITINAAGAVTGSGEVHVAPVASNGATATGGNITVNAQRVGTNGSPLQIVIDAAAGGATNVQGRFSATAADGIFVTSPARYTTGALTTTANGAPISIATTNGETITFAGNITTNNGAVSVDARTLLGSDVVVTANGGTVTFAGSMASPLTPRGLTVTATGLTTFGGALGDFVERLASVSVSGPATLNGNVSTTGAQTYGGNLTLGTSTTLTGTTPTFGGNVLGNGNDLTLNFSATHTVNGATFTGIRDFRSGGGGVTDLAGAFTTTGTQRYDDDVVLTGATTLTGTTPTFGGAVTGGGNDLTLNFSGTTSIDGATFTGIRALTTGNGGTTSLTGPLTTSGAQTYDENVTLAGTTVLNSGAGTVTFAGTLESPATPRALTITSGNAVRFNGVVGGNGNPLASLTTSAPSTQMNGGAVTTTGPQTYNNAVVIGANTSLNSTAGNLSFDGALDADAAANSRTLLVNAPTGTVTFSGNVGANAAFADFDVISSNNTTVFNASSPQTVNVTAGSGGQTISFTGSVRLDQDVTINTGGAANNNVSFNDAINAGAGNRALTVNAGSGDVGVSRVGNTAPLASLALNGDVVTFNQNAISQQIFVGANQALTGPGGQVTALLPFMGFGGPAALTFSGPPSGGIFGTEADPLRIDTTGRLVVTPNESRSLPIVWLTGDLARQPQYEFANDFTRREVVFIFRPVRITDPQQTRELLRRENADLFDEAVDEAVRTAEGAARAPELCEAVHGDADSALACVAAKPK